MALVVGLASACTPTYQQERGSDTAGQAIMELFGGTQEDQLGDGAWLITVKGDEDTSRSAAVAYTYQRAAKLCPLGFDVVDADRSTTTTGIFSNAEKPVAMLAVRCRERPRRSAEMRPAPDGPADADREPRKVVTGVRPVYCTASAQHPDVGSCSLIEEACAALYASLTADGSAYTPCAPAKAAACFNATHVLDGVRVTKCAPTITGCEAQLASLKTNPDFEVTAQACGIYRVTQP